MILEQINSAPLLNLPVWDTLDEYTIYSILINIFVFTLSTFVSITKNI